MYLKSDTSLWLIFSKTCLKMYHLDPSKFLSAPGLASQASLKKIEVKLELLADIDELLMVEKALEEECVMQFNH